MCPSAQAGALSYMKVLLDRRQFGVTITYHFLFVPLTIELAFLVAIMRVLAYRPALGRGSGSGSRVSSARCS